MPYEYSANSLEDALCREIVDYLTLHPLAMDTWKGIREWWLPRHHAGVGAETLGRALDRLVSRQQIERIGVDDRALFRLKTNK